MTASAEMEGREAEAPQSFAFQGYEAEYWRRPDSRGLVIALSGVGITAQPLTSFEFADSLGRRPQVDRLLIRDQERSWYTCQAGWAGLVAQVQDLAASRPYDFVMLVGSSMGAFGALRLAEHLPQARVLAMAPPFSTDFARHGSLVLRHRRWIEAQPDYPGYDIRLVGDPERYLLLFGDADFIDIANCERYLRAGWRHVFVCPGAGHAIPALLKAQGSFGEVMDLLVENAGADLLAAAFGAYPAFPECQAFNLMRARLHLYAGEMAAAERCLRHAARFGLAASPFLMRLQLLHQGLALPPARAVEGLRSLGGIEQVVPLADGHRLVLHSSEPPHPEPEVVLLGPLARCRLEGPELARRPSLRLKLRTEAPNPVNQDGDRRLRVLQVQEGKLAMLGQSRPRDPPLEVVLQGGTETVEFYLRRACFLSEMDGYARVSASLWSTRLLGCEILD